MTDVKVPGGVNWTAFTTARGRAQESLRADRLFDDPVAGVFLGEAIAAQARNGTEGLSVRPVHREGISRLADMFSYYFMIRTPFYDERIVQGVEAGCRQVVLLGAGLDSRAFRLGLPAGVTVFEVDQAPVLEFKDAVLAKHGTVPTCRRVPVAADLRGQWPEVLAAAGFDAAAPAMWVAEGLLPYLPADDCDRLLDITARMSPPGSRFASEYFVRAPVESDAVNDSSSVRDRERWRSVLKMFNTGPVAASPAAWLSAHGWMAGHVSSVAREGQARGRPAPDAFARPGGMEVWLFDATNLIGRSYE